MIMDNPTPTAPANTAGVMPPPETRQLEPETRARLIEYLRQNVVSPEDAALLKRAAQLGMAGAASCVRQNRLPGADWFTQRGAMHVTPPGAGGS